VKVLVGRFYFFSQVGKCSELRNIPVCFASWIQLQTTRQEGMKEVQFAKPHTPLTPRSSVEFTQPRIRDVELQLSWRRE
jgi:hypothetical protein